MVPWAADAIVMAQDGDNYRIMVAIMGGTGAQMTTLPVEMALQGHNDGCCGDFPPLPRVGTHGTVVFTRGDMRNGRWIGSHRSNLTDASPHTATNPNLRYKADFSGGWQLIDEVGQAAHVWADGTSVLLSGAAMPVPTRHTVNASGARQTVPFAAAQRNPNPPSPFPLTLRHGSGVQVTVTPSGATAVSGVAGQPMVVYGDGVAFSLSGGTLTVSGALLVTGPIHSMAEIVEGVGTGATVTLGTHTHPTGGPETGAPNVNT
jgi:hypothetical protein